MSNTIIMGDVAEGQKWFGEAEFLKQQLVSIYNRTNQNMSTWKQVNADVKIFVKMVNGNPQAFIFTDGGYEFFVPTSLISLETYLTNGIGFYNGVETYPHKVLINDVGYEGAILNTWYSESNYVVNIAAAKYRNIFTRLGSTYYYTSVGPFSLYSSGTSLVAKGAVVASSSSASYGRYVWSIQPPASGGICYFVVQDTQTPYYEKIPINGNWEADDYTNSSAAIGYWTFDRSGLRACTTVWVRDFSRFGAAVTNSTTPHIGNFTTSYVLEITISVDGEGVFSGIQVSRQVETDDFCIAADYDWTTEANELLVTTLYGFDYRVDKAKPATQDDIDNSVYLGDEIGEHYRTEYNSGTAVRPRGVYKLDSTYVIEETGEVKANYQDVTSESSAIDIWMKISTLEGASILAVELASNIDVFTKTSSAGTWFEKSGASFVNNISGLDLRIRGITGYSETGAVVASAYDQDWDNGSTLTMSGKQIPTGKGNFYVPDTLYSRIKIMTIPQTIAAIPYLKTTTNEIKNLCIYAPYISNELTGNASAELAIDFRIDIKNDSSTETAIQYGYHRKVYEAIYAETPYLNRYFITGAWAKKKDRK